MAGAAHAEITPWAHNEGGRMRIITLPPEPDGTIRGALQIEPENGWITYWREPGEAGIPPQITFPPESGVTLAAMHFPAPKEFVDGDVRDLGYDHPVALPFTVKAGGTPLPSSLTTSAFIGLCRNICIPFQADFQLNLRASRLPLEENLILDEAMRRLPEPPSPEFSVRSAQIDSAGATLDLRLDLPDHQAEPKIIVVAPEGHVFLDHSAPSQEGDTKRFAVSLEGLKDKEKAGTSNWSVLVILGERAMESSLAIK
ncbi:protein-disulfide reductase DsbD domain-containing protein [Rhizobium helianthi]|uniref:Protein-disulfide reductase DsbD domain-containing protein n=1 Tax=Rhizobium helianthi TaxID=1132695 RepID=A0ABW4M2D9_9HYPH